MVAEHDAAFVQDLGDGHGNESPGNPMETMVLVVLARCSACVFVARWPARELVDSGFRVHRMILPVPVSARDEEVARQILGKPRPHFVPFVPERCVRVVVLLVAAIRADDRGRADQHFPVGVAGEQRFLEPLFLVLAPDGLGGAVLHGVRGIESRAPSTTQT